MSWIVSTNQAQKVPMADSSGERPEVPESFDILATEFTVPMATSHLESITITVEPSNGAGSVEIYARPSNEAEWYLLETIDTSGGEPVSQRLECPIGQLRCKAVTVTSAVVWAQGHAANRT